MKAIKLGILAICIALLGISFPTGNMVAIFGGALAVLFAVVAYFSQNKSS